MKLFLPPLFILIFHASIFSQNLTQHSYHELDSLVMIPYSQGDFAGCIPYMQAGRDKAQKEFGDLDSLFAVYTNNLGYFYKETGQHSKAEPLFIQAINIQEKIFGKEHPEYASSLNNLAGLYYRLGNYEKAEPLYLETTKLYAKTLGEEHPLFATSLDDLASLYFAMEIYEKAEPLFLQAINIRKKVLGKEDPNFAISLNNLALLYQKTGNYGKSEELYLQTLTIWSKALGDQHPYVSAGLNNLALLYKETMQYEKAESLFLQAKNIAAKSYGEQHANYATSLNNLAVLYQAMKNYKKAESLFFQSKEITSKALGEEHLDFSICLNSLALFYRDIGKLDTALRYSQLSIAALSAEIDTNFQAWGDLDKFKYSSNQHINTSIKMFLSILNAQYKKTKDRNKLELYYQIVQAAIRLNERIRNSFTGENDKLRSLSTNHDFVLKGVHVGIELAKKGYEEETFGFVEMNKGVLLMDAAKTANAYKFGDLPDSLIIQEKQLQKKLSNLEAKLAEKRPKTEKDSLLNILNKTNQEITDFTNNLKTKYPKYIALKYERKSANAKQIQALLDDKTALLEYLIGDSMIYIFCVTKNKIELIPNQINFKDLSTKIKEFHSTLSNYQLLATEKSLMYQKYTQNAYWFYTNLVGPALQQTKGISKLIIVSDGELGHLPFESFLTKLASQKETSYNELNYLINDYTISYNYSATLFADAVKINKKASSTTNNGEIFALAANYALATPSNTIAFRLPTYQRLRSTLKPLAEAQKEVQTLAESFNGFFAFDKNASEKIFKEKAGDYAIIHLAMHGLLDAKNPILSSLAFTEDGDSVENNFLQAYEISKMKLNADLVVLSACETGYGRFEKGNGIASLAQAFAYAGAPAMIVTLWQVNDFATSEIMKNLYQNLANGMTKDQALQEAKIKYLKEAQGIAAHPAFWSPFVLIGNTDAVHLKTKGGFWWWILGGGIVLLSGGLIALRSRKKV